MWAWQRVTGQLPGLTVVLVLQNLAQCSRTVVIVPRNARRQIHLEIELRNRPQSGMFHVKHRLPWGLLALTEEKTGVARPVASPD